MNYQKWNNEILDKPTNIINLDKYKPVARLAGSNYSTLGELFQIKRQ